MFGEVHNIEPLLITPATLVYQYSTGASERLIEVRDNGAPITTYTSDLANSKFTLTAAPVGADHRRRARRQALGHLPQRRGPPGAIHRAEFRPQRHTLQLRRPGRHAAGARPPALQAVGRYCDARENVLALCQELAASVGAQVVVTSTGLMRLIRLAPAGQRHAHQRDSARHGRAQPLRGRAPGRQAAARLGYA